MDYSKLDNDGLNCISVGIVADSLSPKGHRLTTFVLEYQRFFHSEVMTHRMLSKNAASSRAIPISKVINQVINNPAIPVWWGKNQSGMQANVQLNGIRKWLSKQLWLKSRYFACALAYGLSKIGLHKQTCNRLLEPWFVMKIIISGTDFENFFALRAHDDAQPEFRVLAYRMLEEYNKSVPKQLIRGQWHIPFGDKFDNDRIDEILNRMCWANWNPVITSDTIKQKIAIARCARISYYNFDGKDDYMKDIDTCDKLFGSVPRHLSPTEHVAQATDSDKYIGNFCGFKQYRKKYEDENLKDVRVIKK
jgi:hypothetical protein